MIEFILIRNPNEILRVKLSKLGFHFQNFIPYKKQPKEPNVKNKNFALESFFLMISCKILKRLKKFSLGFYNGRRRSKGPVVS